MAENVLYVKTAKEWRKWLAKNYDKEKDVWLLYYKKHTGIATIPYDDAVKEALCFGWIDGQVKRIDDEKHMQRYSPRRLDSVWAESNIKRVKELIKAGKMTEAGLEKFKHYEKTRVPSVIGMPEDVQQALKSNEKAWENFENFPASHKKHFFWWVISAKTQKTRQKRINELVKRSEENKRLV